MKCKKIRGSGFMAAGWLVLGALFCSAERLADSLGGWALALVGIMIAFLLMQWGERLSSKRGTPSHLFRR